MSIWRPDLLQGVGSSPPRAAPENKATPQKKPPLSFSYRMSMAVSRFSLDFGLERLSQFDVRSEMTSRLGTVACESAYYDGHWRVRITYPESQSMASQIVRGPRHWSSLPCLPGKSAARPISPWTQSGVEAHRPDAPSLHALTAVPRRPLSLPPDLIAAASTYWWRRGLRLQSL